MSYADFLARKSAMARASGFDPDYLSPQLKDFQEHCTRWALQRGKSALFQGCGLGKTWQAIEWAYAVVGFTEAPVLILTPLAVAAQFEREGAKMGRAVKHVRDPSEMNGPGIYVTNYDRLDKFLPVVHTLGGVVLDESSILKSFDGKTRSALIEAFAATEYKLCCSATPAPNDHTELGNHAEFLGVCKMSEMLATYFVHDGGDTSKWRLKGHARKDFWRWVCSWAICMRKPSDLGFDDNGYDLPPLVMHEHLVDVDRRMAKEAGLLFAYEAASLSEQRAVKRSSLAERVALAADIINASDEQWTVWCELNDESKALAHAIRGAIEVTGSDSAERKETSILDFIDSKHRVLVTKSDIAGMGVNLQNCCNTMFIGTGHSFERFYQTARRHYRFGQTRPVQCHVIATSADGRVVANMQRKQADAETMYREMVNAMQQR